MPYIVLDQEALELGLVEDPPEDGFFVSTAAERDAILFTEIGRTLHFGVLYPYHREKQGDPEGLEYYLVDPDPWLVALAAVMWEGLVQGMTWDAVRLSALKALEFLSLSKLVPTTPTQDEHDVPSEKTKTKSSSQLGMQWIEFSRDGEPLRELFIGLRREYEKKSSRKG